MRKILRSVYFILILILGFSLVFMLKKILVENNENLLESKVKKYREFEDYNELAYWVAVKNGDWSDLKLTDAFRKKYNEKDGIFGDMQFDKVEYCPYHDGEYPFEGYSYLVVTQGKKKTAYLYSMVPDMGDGYNDIIITNSYQLTDKNGNKIDFREGITEQNYHSQFYSLAWGYEDEQCVGVTEKFHSKYPYFLDIFEHYSPLKFNQIEYVKDKSSWSMKEAFFVVDSRLECKKRSYKVNYTLDDRGYLDDVIVKNINVDEYEGSFDEIAAKLLYNKSNWDKLEITNNYRLKYNGFSYNKDIEKIDIDYEVKSDYIDNNNYYEYLFQYKMKNGTTSIYYIKYIMDEKGNIDDIECKKLAYDNIPLKDAKVLYLKKHNK